MNILKFQDFINESINESGIPLYRGADFSPESTIKRNSLLSDLKNLLTQVANGSLTELSIVAEIPTQGKNTPEYLKDIYREMGMDTSEKPEDQYDPETDVYVGRRDHPDDTSQNIFVDSQFIVKDVDEKKGTIIATPYSLRKKEIMVEIDPNTVEEVFIK